MLYSTFLLAATAFSGAVVAQNSSSPVEGLPTSIEPCCKVNSDLVPDDKKTAWCRAQTNSCASLCGQASINTCVAATLNYNCTCSSGTAYNISDYTETLPFYICQQWVAECVSAHPNDLDGVTACRSVTCGSKNATSGSSSSSASASSTSSAAARSSSAAASASGSSAASQSASATASTSAAATSSGAAVALGLAKSYGAGALAAGMLAAFGLAL